MTSATLASTTHHSAHAVHNNRMRIHPTAILTQLLDRTRTRLCLLLAVVILGGVYLWLVNDSASAGFALTGLEKNVAVLEEEYQKLELEQAELQSLQHIQKMSEQAGLVTGGLAEYVATDSAVALVEDE